MAQPAASTVSPYLSPPTEFLSLDASLKRTIDPQKLTTAAQSREQSPTGSSPGPLPQFKMEHDDDYGFSKFAAERDAERDLMDMDEDTKLLMSEEGKKLSSKERRQLRNKVSARNFRERRKEYITHLESLVSKHQNDADLYKSQVDTLTVEKDELSAELAKLKISISAAIESNKLIQQGSAGQLTLTRSVSRSGTPTREQNLIPTLSKDINPYSANSNFNVDWPLSNIGSPSSGSFDFNLQNYTSVFAAHSVLPTPAFSEKELLGKSSLSEESPSCDSLEMFDQVLSSILGSNWHTVSGN